MRRTLLLLTIALSSLSLGAQEVEERLPRGWQPLTEYPLAWSGEGDFQEWKQVAREKIVEHMGIAPEAPTTTSYRIVAEEQRDGYKARKIALEISRGNHIKAYLLIPDGEGPFPAIVALHDHGAKFSIGKEKMIRPIDESPAVVDDAREWVEKNYEGVWTGDLLASRGYVVLAIDALMWGNRGEGEEGRQTRYDTQQALGSNCLKLGTTLVGIITWDDLRSIEFLAAQPFVNPKRIGVYGHSMGGHRAWMAAALSDRVAATASICWMATAEALLKAGNNELKGGSAFSMQVPFITRWLDNPDIASLACPNPVLFISGLADKLFPAGVEEAYEQMRNVWESRGAAENITCTRYPAPHCFNRAMQAEVVTFFEKELMGGR